MPLSEMLKIWKDQSEGAGETVGNDSEDQPSTSSGRKRSNPKRKADGPAAKRKLVNETAAANDNLITSKSFRFE